MATLAGALSMWIMAGIWHNLILPSANKDIHPHHDGIFIGLVAYIILAFLIVYIYSITIDITNNHVMKGFIVGIIIGILWVFPHGLAMAGVHKTSIIYEIKNTLYHIFEQGVGGIVIALTYGKQTLLKQDV